MSENMKNAVNVTCQGTVTFSGRESTCQHARDSGSIPGSGRPLKVEMATCSSSAGLQSMGLQAVRHKLATKHQ